MVTVLVVIGTRPEAIKLSPVVISLQEDSRFEVHVCSSGQHKDMVRPVCDIFGINIDYDLSIMKSGQTIDYVTKSIIEGLPQVFAACKPDIVMVQGDTTTAFSAALSAFYHKIDVAHVEAGLRTNDISSPWPEEGNRALIGRIAKYHFAPTAASYSNLRNENVPGLVFETGNTVVDAAIVAAQKIQGARELQIALKLGLADLKRPKVLFTLHRREAFGGPAERMFEMLRDLATRHEIDVLYPVHPNPNVAEPARRILSDMPNVHLLDPLDYDEMIFALKHARLLLTDSGGLAEEAPTFGTPTLILRESTERPESIHAGAAKLVGYDVQLIQSLVEELLRDSELYRAMSQARNPYGDGRAASRITDILADRTSSDGMTLQFAA